jgi:hypothetical protein
MVCVALWLSALSKRLICLIAKAIKDIGTINQVIVN